MKDYINKILVAGAIMASVVGGYSGGLNHGFDKGYNSGYLNARTADMKEIQQNVLSNLQGVESGVISQVEGRTNHKELSDRLKEIGLKVKKLTK